jgi:uncharacterized protein YdaU (DUF1376 family)
MNFYPHHIGDFNNATRHLTRVEQSVYRGAIELYYDTESALTTDLERLAKRLLCVNAEEKEALKTVLDEFFTQTENGYKHERCEKEIAKYRANTGAKAKAGIASALARKQKSTPVQQSPTGVEQKSTPVHNQEPLTKNQEPEEIPKKNKQKKVDRPVGVAESVWADFMTLREAKKSPITATALARIEKEADKALISLQEALELCCSRGWQGFEACWINKAVAGNATPQAESFYAQDQRIKRERWEAMTGRKWPEEGAPSIDANIIDAEPFGLLEGDL